MPRPRLKLAFSDFWADFDPQSNFFLDVLRTRFEVELSSHPDVLICSTFGHEWKAYSCFRILFTGENLPPDPRFFDASLSFEPTSGTNYYLPLYRLYACYPLAFQERTLSRSDWERKKRIGMVFSNAKSKFRTWTFHRLNRTLGVDSGGRAFNNVGGPVADKGKFLGDYRFSVAFENTRWPGYTTEKLIEAYSFGTVPLYWGNPGIAEVFNPRSFLSVEGKADFPRLLGQLETLLGDYDSFKAIYEEPLFPGNQEPEFLRSQSIAAFLETAIAGGRVRTQARPPSDLQVYQWGHLWKYREWDQKYRGWIAFLRRFSWVGYALEKTKGVLKRYLRKAA